ncbi:MAG: AAA family ATPase [Alphaproteobacteria bacterium]|nr:AAA family ATPase [Alphaproteobacteria bacterium]
MNIHELVKSRKVIVCAGSGGVGKTTTATAIALAAARSGRKVLALTVDPSKRLAQTLGVDRNLAEPIAIPAERREEAGIEEGMLEAWMLDPRVVADNFVNRFADTPEEAARLINNRLYRQISRMVAGMQEYMAMEALYTFLREERYDLVVLDTPPSRNALDFLYGPSRLSSFLDGRIFQLFLPEDTGRRSFIRRAAGRLVNRVNAAIFGAELYEELQEFMSSFSGIFRSMNKNAADGMVRLRDPATVAFLLVTSPATESLTDAFFFRRKTIELELPFRGFVLNRSQAAGDARVLPDGSLFGPKPSELQASALEKLLVLARIEQAAVERHQKLLDQLRRDAGSSATAVALPVISSGADEMRALVHLGDVLMES